MHRPAFIALLLSSSVSATVLDVLSPRQSTNNTVTEEYLQRVCYPPSTDPVPPCQSIINIQTACEPNGTTPLALSAHAQCMCGGSFFSDWEGCLACNTVHGGRSPRVSAAFIQIISSASNILCTGTPTASFPSIFSGLSADSGVNEGGNDVASDRFPDQTAISLYYTATNISQGPGAITGSATAATRTGPRTEEGVRTTSSSAGQITESTSTRRTGTTSSGANAASTSSSAGGVAPTGVWMGALGMVAGGAVMAVL